MDIPEFLRTEGISLHALSLRAELSYSTIHGFVKHGKPIGLKAARKLEAATGGRISAAEVLGLKVPSAEPPAPPVEAA